MNLKTKNDDDDEADGGSSSPANSLKAIDYIKAALKKKLDVTDNYMKYIDDSKKLIDTQMLMMDNIIKSDVGPK